jgi:NAD(P)-dependent dehydrogenase (short-subunit alcohol dehydrogenase family)
MLRFSGTNVLLTGAASGIGRVTATRLLSEGAALFAVDRDAEGLDELVRSSSCVPGRVVTATIDVTDEPAVGTVVAAAADALGGIDVLVNVAGAHRTMPIDQHRVADRCELSEVDCVGTALFCRETVRHLLDGHGVIVNVASKGAVLAFSLGLAAELAGRGMRVVPVSPGTGPIDQARVAGAIAFAASRDASYLTGAELRVDGGAHI